MSKVQYSHGTRYLFYCPGCKCSHFIDTNIWEFNGDLNNPTVYPSIKVTGTVPITDEERDIIMRGETFEPKPFICHYFVKNGYIEFLKDCTHELRGQTVELENEDD